MVKIEIEIESKYKSLAPWMPKIQERGLKYTSDYMIERLQVFSPIDTGYLKGWFRYKQQKNMIDIRSPAQYAIYQDQGTKRHGAKNGKALVFDPPKGWKGPIVKKGKLKGKVVVKSVKGIKGKQFVQKSIDATTPRLKEFFIKAIGDVMK